MKRILKVSLMAVVILLFAGTRNKASAQVSVSVSFQTFYDNLSPYGTWINNPDYGYVWQPSSRYDNFHPYQSDGHWAWSEDYGWVWVSDYEWGWAPFHYGRWTYDEWYGWLWVPDYEWGPGWVTWRTGGNYYGWAPMSPGISINLYFGNRYRQPNNYWCFVDRQYISSPHISNYYVDRSRNMTIINNTTIINNNYGGGGRGGAYSYGPSRTDAQRYTRDRIQSYNVRQSDRPGRTSIRQNDLSIYRPNVRRESGRNEAPQRAETYRPNRGGNDVATRGNTTQNRGFDRNDRTNNENSRVEQRSIDRNDRQYNPNRGGRANVPDQQQRPDIRTNENRNRGQQIERPNQGRGQQIERQQAPQQNNQRIERPNQGRGQQIERQQAPQQNNQRFERPSQGRGQQIERQQAPQQNNQRFERPQQQQPQVQSQPQQQQQQRGNGNENGGGGNGRGKGRGN